MNSAIHVTSMTALRRFDSCCLGSSSGAADYARSILNGKEVG